MQAMGNPIGECAHIVVVKVGEVDICCGNTSHIVDDDVVFMCLDACSEV